MELLAACEKLKGSLESPFDAAARIVFGVSFSHHIRRRKHRAQSCTNSSRHKQGHQAIALGLGVDMKLFDAAAAHGVGMRIEQFASEIGADKLLVSKS